MIGVIVLVLLLLRYVLQMRIVKSIGFAENYLVIAFVLERMMTLCICLIVGCGFRKFALRGHLTWTHRDLMYLRTDLVVILLVLMRWRNFSL